MHRGKQMRNQISEKELPFVWFVVMPCLLLCVTVKMIYIQTDVQNLQHRPFGLFSALLEVTSETQEPPPPPPPIVCGAVIFLPLRWKVLRKLWRQASGTCAGW